MNMEKVRRFEDLEVFQRARMLCKEIYRITKVEPFKNDFRFVQQIRASSGSIMDNIAEGFERNGNKEYINFLYIAKGSCGELRSQLLRAFDAEFVGKEDFDKLYNEAEEIGKLLFRLIQSIRQKGNRGSKYL